MQDNTYQGFESHGVPSSPPTKSIHETPADHRPALPVPERPRADPETLPSSQRYGWFQSEQWAREQMMGAPGWQLQSRGTDAGGWQYVLFSDKHHTKGITYRLLDGRVGGITYAFFEGNPEGRVWRTAEMQQVGPNEWTDPKNNARVKRRYNGQLTAYEVVYEPLTKD